MSEVLIKPPKVLFIDSEIEGRVDMRGGGIDIQDSIVFKGCESLLLRKGKGKTLYTINTLPAVR
jgi:hypothetical protein